jgi:hypothetical protein
MCVDIAHFAITNQRALKSPDASLENLEVLLVSQSSIATHPKIVLTGAQTSKPTFCDVAISLPLRFGFPFAIKVQGTSKL